MSYLPIVQKVIQREKPFKQQISRIPNQNKKKIKINNGKDIYKGLLNESNQPIGIGILIKQNKSVLVGNFINGNIQGKVFYVFNNGSYYQGEMNNSQANDQHGQFHSVAFTYLGGFVDNMFHGECIELGDTYFFQGFYENNKKIKGNLKWEVKKGKNNNNTNQESLMMEMQNTQMNKQTTSIISHLIDNQIQLPPIRQFENLPKYKYSYEGTFDQSQKFQGNSTLSTPCGIYKGQFLNGLKHGKGIFQYHNKLRYQGEYFQDKKSGQGILFNCDDTIAYEGEWNNDLPNGSGISYDLNGNKTYGKFKEGLNEHLLDE